MTAEQNEYLRKHNGLLLKLCAVDDAQKELRNAVIVPVDSLERRKLLQSLGSVAVLRDCGNTGVRLSARRDVPADDVVFRAPISELLETVPLSVPIVAFVSPDCDYLFWMPPKDREKCPPSLSSFIKHVRQNFESTEGQEVNTAAAQSAAIAYYFTNMSYGERLKNRYAETAGNDC